MYGCMYMNIGSTVLVLQDATGFLFCKIQMIHFAVYYSFKIDRVWLIPTPLIINYNTPNNSCDLKLDTITRKQIKTYLLHTY
ncbi:hypothetical protein QVD17_27141 [Tagetes erecta]|uniref:Uncharacterized protein n=1 Tax=Tagetes erecta TaxID=13708 RepID=A0AAD8NJ45_TARER|nr:hypothetical protein QVD17_27141 [Tagetes erecta]